MKDVTQFVFVSTMLLAAVFSNLTMPMANANQRLGATPDSSFPTSSITVGGNQPTVDTSCSSQLRMAAQQAIFPYEQSIIQLAVSSSYYNTQVSSGLVAKFYSINQYWVFSGQCQNPSLEGVGVIFSLSDASGLQTSWLEVKEDSAFASVTGSSTCVNRVAHFPCGASCNAWNGWEFYGGNGLPPVLESEISFTEPTLSSPSQGCPTSGHCGVSPWAGLEHVPGGSSNGLAQAGTDVVINCNAGCTQTDSSLYEQLPAGSVQCTPSGGISAGQTITVIVYNEASYGGNTNYYDYAITDNTTGHSCITNGVYYGTMNNPVYSSHIYEWLEVCPPPNYQNYCDYPVYNQGSPHGGTWYYYNGYYQLVGVYIPWSAGFSKADHPMTNTCAQYGTVTNADSGNPNSNSVWAVTYYTSHCT